MKNERNGLSLTIIGLIIAAIGVIAPISWDWWNKKSELTLEVSDSATIIKKENSIQNLKISYAGKDISSLTKNTLTLKNTGRTPISNDDVISNILVKIEDGTLLEANKVKEIPANINASITLKDNGFNIRFDLLNPNDEIDISILSSGINPKFNSEARIKNIPSILLSSPSENYQIQKNIGWKIYVVGILSLLLGVVGIALLAEIPKKRKLISSLHEVISFENKTQSDVKHFINNDMEFITSARRLQLCSHIDKIIFPINKEDEENLKNTIENTIKDDPSLGAAMLTFLTMGAGLWYVLSNVVSF